MKTKKHIYKHLLVLVVSSLGSTQMALAQDSAQRAAQRAGQEKIASRSGPFSRFGITYQETCAVCHGEQLQGAAQGTQLRGELMHGDSVIELARNIGTGFPDQGMPAWSEVFTQQQIKSMALWISEYRNGMLYTDTQFNINDELTIPAEAIETELHDIRIEVVVDGLDPLPYSIASLPNGDILLTEKIRGLRIISSSGEKSELIQDTPKVYADIPPDARPSGMLYGIGWLFDVTLHPRYADNGWIYLHYTDRCSDCNELSRQSKRDVSMNALVRGRIKDGRWVDEESIWKAPIESYTSVTDIAAGGRTAIDPNGFVFISVGLKSIDGIQDLQSPHGKIHRVHDDGRIPTDNPFIDNMHAGNTIWSYGHRSPQGLVFNNKTRELWGTEHGPRGGDEVNLLLPGRNYGWPAFSRGQNYDGTEVNHGRDDLELEFTDITQPIVDLTPSPAVSSLVFYEGDAFPEWRDDIIVGSLKAANLYRIEIENNEFVRKETLISNLTRIRDVELGPGGIIYLLLEHSTGGQIVRVVQSTSDDDGEVAQH